MEKVNTANDIATLNALFGKFSKAAETLTSAYEDAFVQMDERLLGKRKCYEAAKAKFELFRRQMKLSGTPTKFDMVSGEYFKAVKDGREVFHVELQEVRTAVVEVAAESSDKAVQAALEMAKDGKVELTAKPVEASDVSR